MHPFRIRLAERTIQITPRYDGIREYCKDYLCPQVGAATQVKADFAIEITPSDIAFEREKSAAEDEKEGLPVRNFSDCYLETLAVYRKIAEGMLDYDTLLLHGSAIGVDGGAYLFTAKSGTGKSTHTRLWREYFGQRAVMVNDDKPLVKVGAGGAIVYGTPWDGKHRLSTNTSVPLNAICILTRSAENHIRPIARSDAYATLLQQTHRPAEAQKMAKTLSLLDRLLENAALYQLGCNMEPEAAEVAYHGMRGA